MQEFMNKMRSKRADDDQGFTLIELLVVVVIIGVLVAIAVPVYLNYRKGAANKSAASDVRGAISAVEQFYTENGNRYPADVAGTKGQELTFTALSDGTAQKATVSDGNTLVFDNTSDTSYVICGQSADGGGVYGYSSSVGGSVKKSTKTLALCASSGP